MIKEDTAIRGLFDIDEILKILPHGYPFVLIDKIVQIHLGKEIVAVKNVTYNEPFFVGHFRSKPVMPGVLIIESMAQAAIMLAAKSAEQEAQKTPYLVGINKARFRHMVRPGDVLQLHVKLASNKVIHGTQLWTFDAVATVEGEEMASASILAILK